MLLTIVEQQTLRKCQMFTDSTSDRITSPTYINLIIDLRAQIMYRKELDRWTFCGPNMYLQWLGYCLQGQLVVINIQTRGKRKWHYLNLLSSYLAFLSTMTTLTLHHINLTTQDRPSNTGAITSCHQTGDTVGPVKGRLWCVLVCSRLHC